MARKNVGELAVGQEVTVAGREAERFVIVAFPSRRIVLLAPVEEPKVHVGVTPIAVSRYDLRPAEGR